MQDRNIRCSQGRTGHRYRCTYGCEGSPIDTLVVICKLRRLRCLHALGAAHFDDRFAAKRSACYPVTTYADPGGNNSLPSMPPSTMIFMPLTCPLSTGLAITATCLATSSGRATFCSGVVEIARSTKAVSLRVSVAIGVATQPGLTELTRPLGAMRTISFLSCVENEGQSAGSKHYLALRLCCLP